MYDIENLKKSTKCSELEENVTFLTQRQEVTRNSENNNNKKSPGDKKVYEQRKQIEELEDTVEGRFSSCKIEWKPKKIMSIGG